MILTSKSFGGLQIDYSHQGVKVLDSPEVKKFKVLYSSNLKGRQGLMDCLNYIREHRLILEASPELTMNDFLKLEQSIDEELRAELKIQEEPVGKPEEILTTVPV